MNIIKYIINLFLKKGVKLPVLLGIFAPRNSLYAISVVKAIGAN